METTKATLVQDEGDGRWDGVEATAAQIEASQAAPGGIITIDGEGRVVKPGSYEEQHPEQVGGLSKVWVD